MKNKSIVIISILVLVGIFFAAMSFYKADKDSKIQAIASKGSNEPFTRDYSVSFGENKKNIVVVEFMDPQCGACAAFHSVVKELYKNYYEDIKIVVRYLDNHRHSKYVIKILESARLQNKYQEVLDVIFKTQNIWAMHGSENPLLIWQHLTNIQGLNMDKLRTDFDNINIDEMLKLDRVDAGKLGIRGTPSFFVNKKELEKLSAQGLFDLVEAEIYK